MSLPPALDFLNILLLLLLLLKLVLRFLQILSSIANLYFREKYISRFIKTDFHLNFLETTQLESTVDLRLSRTDCAETNLFNLD